MNFSDPFGLSPCSDLRRKIDEVNDDYDIRSFKYVLYSLIGEHDTGHYQMLRQHRNTLVRLTRDYANKCDGTDDDDDDWRGGSEARENVGEFSELPFPAVVRSHGHKKRKPKDKPSKPDPAPDQILYPVWTPGLPGVVPGTPVPGRVPTPVRVPVPVFPE